MFEMSLKQKILASKTLFCLTCVFSQKACFLYFWSKPGCFGETHLCSTTDYQRMERGRKKKVFPDERRESDLSFGSFGVYIVIEHNFCGSWKM